MSRKCLYSACTLDYHFGWEFWIVNIYFHKIWRHFSMVFQQSEYPFWFLSFYSWLYFFSGSIYDLHMQLIPNFLIIYLGVSLKLFSLFWTLSELFNLISVTMRLGDLFLWFMQICNYMFVNLRSIFLDPQNFLGKFYYDHIKVIV